MPNTGKDFRTGIEKRLILVVDDEMINREILSEYLKDDYEVLTAENGRQAMDLIRDHKDTLSLIMLDLLMPVMSGKEVLKQIREDKEISQIPVIVTTGDQESEVECLSLGAIDFIPKPYPQPGVVLARIHRTIELFEDRQTIWSTEKDPLTGLLNREYFYRYAEQFDTHHKGWEMDAVIADINNFHVINERYGKPFGDEVLRRVGELLAAAFTEFGGIVGRKEADTFMIYIPHRRDYNEQLQKVIAGLSKDENMGNRVRLRLGVYSNVDKNIEMERRFDRAKTAADTVHGNLKNMIGIYDDAMHEKEIFTEQLIDDFQIALDEKQFIVYFQPKFDVRYDKPFLTGAEALVRWMHPTLGTVSPGIFIPLFENNGLIQKLDTYVWTETGRQIREWKDRLGYAIPVSVNVSRLDLYDQTLIPTLSGILERFSLSTDDLNLEITESAYTNDSGQIVETVSKLRNLGFKIEMDDFGTGYSSLNMISTLPIDAMKLDMQFVRNAFKEGGDSRMMEVIIEIAAYLSVPVTAEGVETEEQLLSLKALGCDIVQGYYFSKPVSPDEFEPFIVEGHEARAAAEAELLAKEKAEVEQGISDVTRMHKGTFDDSSSPAPITELRTERRKSEEKGRKLQTMNYMFVAIAIFAALVLFTADTFVRNGYKRMQQASNRYITAQQAVADMEIGSDYLTDRVRSFVFTGDKQYMNDFFEEVNVTRRREHALSILGSLLDNTNNSAYESLETALRLSNELIGHEYLAMRLRLKADNAEEIPDVLSDIEISDDDLALDKEEMLNKARLYLFDDYYIGHKEQIRANVRNCSESLINTSSEELEQATLRMDWLLRIQTFLTAVFLVTVLGMVVFIRRQVRKPLTHMVELMRAQKAVPPTGAEELRYVTRTYNQILMENNRVHAELTYAAYHDALTGLYNRGAYEMFLKSIDMEHAALIIVDVDDFKSVNDHYGHDIGDKVLKRVADTLKHSFRSDDVICRIGGDEFVVVMVRANSSMEQVVRNKIAQINQTLQKPFEDVPAVTLSVGVAFSDRKNPQGDIFKDADTAVFRSKNEGKGRCSIY